MKITVFGAGYVGLVSAACFAELGNSVLVVDTNKTIVERLNRGEIPIHEAGLTELVRKNVDAGRLSFTDNAIEAIYFGRLQFICVGTPTGENGEADLSAVKAVARKIGQHMPEYRLVINKSTAPIGTCDEIKAIIQKELQARKSTLEFCIASNPEFLKEGKALEDFMRPDRVIIGAEDPKAFATLRQLYAPYLRNFDRILEMDLRSAEMTKYAANAMLATRISFMNELAHLAENLGADIEFVRRGIGSDSRIGRHFLYAGCGYGGSCFPKDISALTMQARNVGSPLTLLESVAKINTKTKDWFVDKVTNHFGEDLTGMTFALWGLAFKPNTDDMRDAPSLHMMQKLISKGAKVNAYDPIALERAKSLMKNEEITYHTNAKQALEGADALIITTEWKEFNAPDFEEMASILHNPVIFDGRNMYDPVFMQEQGIIYYPFGRAQPKFNEAGLVPEITKELKNLVTV